jgi:SAM-dependent methyltransferase
MTVADETLVALAFPAPIAALFGAIGADASGLPSIPAAAQATADILVVSGLGRWNQDQTRAALRELRRVLRPGGILRLSTPDLDAAVQDYAFSTAQPNAAETRAQRLNIWFRRPDQAWVHNEEDLVAILEELGFADIRRFVPGAGSHPLFWDLDVGAAGLLVLEARRAKAV